MIELTDAEWEVMKVLWEEGSLPLSQVVSRLQELGIPWVSNTVHTLLTRLSKKDVINILKDRTPFQYKAVVNRELCEQQETKKIMDKVFSGSYKRMISSLLTSEEVSEEEIDSLMEVISDFRNRGGKP
jgi:BlaI family penicillinase repressor